MMMVDEKMYVSSNVLFILQSHYQTLKKMSTKTFFIFLLTYLC